METSNRLVSGMKKIGLFILLLGCVAGIAGSVYLYRQNQKLQQDPSEAAQQEVDSLVAQVGEVMQLPSGETPTIATVTDPAKLQDQSFFVQAQVGDKVLLYTNAKKAILYRPSTKKIIEVAPINLGQETTATGDTTVTTNTSDTSATTP